MKGLSGIKRTPLRNLAEAIILQAIEDLWNSRLRNESIDFFRGEGFMRYARMAGMTRDEVFRILAIAEGSWKGADHTILWRNKEFHFLRIFK